MQGPPGSCTYLQAACGTFTLIYTHAQIFVVSDSRSGTCVTGGGRRCNKRAKALSEKGLNQNQRGIKGWRDRRKDWSPAVSTPERSLVSSMCLSCVFLESLHHPLAHLSFLTFFPFFFLCYFSDAEQDVAVRPAPLLIHSKITTVCCLKAAFWIQRQKMAGRQRVAPAFCGGMSAKMFRPPPPPAQSPTSTHILPLFSCLPFVTGATQSFVAEIAFLWLIFFPCGHAQ